MAREKLGRNAPCRCGSGRKYKKCHLAADEKAEAERHGPAVPRARAIEEIWRSVLPPPQLRSDEVGPERK